MAVSARAGANGLASIVAPMSAAIANERASGMGVGIAWKRDDMMGSLTVPDEIAACAFEWRETDRLNCKLASYVTIVSYRKLLMPNVLSGQG
jgi:hypothetical protein